MPPTPSPTSTVSIDSGIAATTIWSGGVGAPFTLFSFLGLSYSVVPVGITAISANITLGSLSIVASGSSLVSVAGSASITLGSLVVNASASAATSGVSVDSSNTALLDWTGGVGAPQVSFGMVGLSFSVLPAGIVNATANVILGGLTASASGAIETDASADITLGPLVTNAIVASGIGGFAAITLGSMSVAAIGFIPPIGSASITLGPLIIDAAGTGGGPQPSPGLQSTTFIDFFASVEATLNATNIFGPKNIGYVIEPDASEEYPVLPPPYLLVEPGEFVDNGWSEGGGRNTKVWETDLILHLVVRNALDPAFFAGNVVTSNNTTFGIYAIAQLIIDKFEQAYIQDTVGQLQLVELPVSPRISKLSRKGKAGEYVSVQITFSMLVAENLPSPLP